MTTKNMPLAFAQSDSFCLLKVASGLGDWFTPETLTVHAHRQYAGKFALKGYPQFPDHHKTIWRLCGTKGLVGRGLLERRDDGKLRITDGGRFVIEDIERPKRNDSEQSRLNRSQERLIRTLLSSEAKRLFDAGKTGDISLTTATAFWGVGHENAATVIRSLDRFLDEMLSIVENGAVTLANGDKVTAGDVKLLRNLSNWLVNRFGKRLGLEERRAG